jgi:hypothetical protein
MTTKQESHTTFSPMRDAPGPAVKMKPQGIEPARTKSRPAPKSSASSREKNKRAEKERARQADLRAAMRTARASSAPSECKPVKLAEALREKGIDERTIAESYANLHGKLGRSEDKGDLKLLVEVLEKNARTLEPPRPPDRSGSDGPVTVILQHCVPRPQR